MNAKSQEWDKLTANKMSTIKIILDQYDENTRAKITLSPSYEDNLKAGELIEFLMRVGKVCNNTEVTDVFLVPM